MKSLKDFITELKNPAAVQMFKKDVAHVDTVDARSQTWATTLPKYMKEHGFSVLGKGKYAQVYGHPSYDYVIKVFLKDAAYLRWIKFCQENKSNPFVPKMKGKVIKITPYIYAIRLEKLTAYSSYKDKPFMKAFREWQKTKGTFRSEDVNIQNILDEFSKNRSLLDLHGENLMYRGNEEVVVDPYYNWFIPSKGSFTIDPEEVDKSLF